MLTLVAESLELVEVRTQAGDLLVHVASLGVDRHLPADIVELKLQGGVRQQLVCPLQQPLVVVLHHLRGELRHRGEVLPDPPTVRQKILPQRKPFGPAHLDQAIESLVHQPAKDRGLVPTLGLVNFGRLAYARKSQHRRQVNLDGAVHRHPAQLFDIPLQGRDVDVLGGFGAGVPQPQGACHAPSHQPGPEKPLDLRLENGQGVGKLD